MPMAAMGLEAIVEVIYPIDQAIGTAILVAANQIYTITGIGMSILLEEHDRLRAQKC